MSKINVNAIDWLQLLETHHLTTGGDDPLLHLLHLQFPLHRLHLPSFRRALNRRSRRNSSTTAGTGGADSAAAGIAVTHSNTTSAPASLLPAAADSQSLWITKTPTY